MKTYSLIKIFGHADALNIHEIFLLRRHSHCILSRLRCNGHSAFLISLCPVQQTLRRLDLGVTSSTYDI